MMVQEDNPQTAPTILYIQMDYCTGDTLQNLIQAGTLRNQLEEVFSY